MNQDFSTPKSMSIYELYEAFKAGKLHLRPIRSGKKNSFQRWQWWALKKKIYLIHSIYEKTTLPPIYLYKGGPNKGHYYIVDGQQRLSALFEFLEDYLDDKDPKKSRRSAIRLTQKGMMENDKETLDEELEGKRWLDLTQDQQDDLGTYELRVEELVRPRGMDEDDFDTRVRKFFHRINVTSGGMSEQEVRNNTYAGDLTDLLFSLQNTLGFCPPGPLSVTMDPKKLGESYFFTQNRICSSTDLLRMEDMDLTLSLLHAIHVNKWGEKVVEKEKDANGVPTGRLVTKRYFMPHKASTVDSFHKDHESLSAEQTSWLSESFLKDIGVFTSLAGLNLFDLGGSRFRKKNDFFGLFVAIERKRVATGFDATNFDVLASNLTRFGEAVGLAEDGTLQSSTEFSLRVKALAQGYYDNIKENWSLRPQRETRVKVLLEILEMKRYFYNC